MSFMGKLLAAVIGISLLCLALALNHKASNTVGIDLSRDQINYFCGANAAINADFTLDGNNTYISCSNGEKIIVKNYPSIVLKGLLTLKNNPTFLNKNKFHDTDIKEAFAGIYDLNLKDVNLNKKAELTKAAEHSLKVNAK